MIPGALKPGSLIEGKYRLERLLGRGGMGAVFLATHEGLNRKVAVKVLDMSVEHNPEAAERFKREGRAAAAIGHTGVVEVLDSGATDSGLPFLVMEYLEGPTLREFYKARGPFEPQLVSAIVLPILDTLGAAHSQGILHRDLKPANVLMCTRPRREVKLLDFGISKFMRSVTVITRTGVALGTPQYMAPEQMEGEKDLTAAADLYSVGVLLFELLCGRPPFTADNEFQLMRKVVMTEAPRLQVVKPGLPADLNALVDALLRKSPAERPGRADEVRQALLAVAQPAHELLWSQVEQQLLVTQPQVAVPLRDKATPDPSLESAVAVNTVDLAPATTRQLAVGKPRRYLPVVLGGAVATAAIVGFGTLELSWKPRPVSPVTAVVDTTPKPLVLPRDMKREHLPTPAADDDLVPIDPQLRAKTKKRASPAEQALLDLSRAHEDHERAGGSPNKFKLKVAIIRNRFSEQMDPTEAALFVADAQKLKQEIQRANGDFTAEVQIREQQLRNKATLAKADEAILAGELKRAEELLALCKVGGQPCPEAKVKLEKIRDEKKYKALLDKAERAIADKKVQAASALMGEAWGTEVFKERHRELENRLRDMMSQSLIGKPPPKPEVAVAAQSPWTPPPGSNLTANEKLVAEARDHIKKLQYPQAKTRLLACIKTEPNNPECHKLLGSTYAFLKDNKKGVFHYKKFIELVPDDPSAPKVKGMIEAFESSQTR